MKNRRGTTNRNVRGNTEDRRKRRDWLAATYASDVPGHCRCYRCGTLLTTATLTVDRIIPGSAGGTYVRNNIRPCCGACNSITAPAAKAARQAQAASTSPVEVVDRDCQGSYDDGCDGNVDFCSAWKGCGWRGCPSEDDVALRLREAEGCGAS